MTGSGHDEAVEADRMGLALRIVLYSVQAGTLVVIFVARRFGVSAS